MTSLFIKQDNLKNTLGAAIQVRHYFYECEEGFEFYLSPQIHIGQHEKIQVLCCAVYTQPSTNISLPLQ